MLQDMLIVRDMVESDTGYVMQTWLDDLRKADRGFLPNDLWFPAHRECLTRLLAREGTQAKVLCDKENPTIIIAYLVFDDTYLYWIHVRRAWRMKGVAKHLLTELACINHQLVWPTKLGHERLNNTVSTQSARRAVWASE